MKLSKVMHIHDLLLFLISEPCSNYSRRIRYIRLVSLSVNFGATIRDVWDTWTWSPYQWTCLSCKTNRASTYWVSPRWRFLSISFNSSQTIGFYSPSLHCCCTGCWKRRGDAHQGPLVYQYWEPCSSQVRRYGQPTCTSTTLHWNMDQCST